MSDSLENIVDGEDYKKKNASIADSIAKPESIDDIINAPDVQRLAERQQEKIEGRTSFFKKIMDIGSFATSLYLQFKFLPARLVYTSMIPMLGFLWSKKRSEKREGKEFNWAKFFRTAYLGQIMGYADVAIFSLPEYLLNIAPSIFTTGSAFSGVTSSSLGKKLLAGTATSLVFNPGMIPAYNLMYTTATYFRDKIGYVKAMLSPHKLVHYLRDMYKTEIKGKWVNDTKNVFKKLFGLHWLQMVVHPNVYTRLLQSIFVNNKLYADSMEREKKKNKSGIESVVDMTDYKKKDDAKYQTYLPQPS